MNLKAIKLLLDATGMRQGAKEAEDALKDVGDSAQDTAKEIDRLEKELEDLEKEARNGAKELDKVDKAQKAAANSAKRLGLQVLGAVAGYQALRGVMDLIRELAAFEQGLVAVGKTADISGEKLDQFGERLLKFSFKTGATAAELQHIAVVAGQLGLRGSENIANFTETIFKLQSASQGTLAGETGATALAKMLNVSGEGTDKVEELASVIVALGNNAAATEGRIAHLGTQVALSTSAFDVSSAESAAMGATLAELGVRAELAATTIGRTMRMMDREIRAGGEGLKLLSEVMRQSEEQIENTFGRNPMQGVIEFVEALGRVSEEGGSVELALEAFNLEGEQLLKVMPTLAVNARLLQKNFGLMTKDLEDQAAITNEFNRAQDTLGTELKRNATAWAAAKQKLNESNGAMQAFAKFTADTQGELFNLNREVDDVATGAALMATALKVAAVPATYIALTSLAGATKALGTALVVAKARQWAFNAAVNANPYVMAASALAAVSVALFAFSTDAEDANDRAVELAETMGRLGDEADRLTDLDIALERALRLGDAGKEASTYSSMIHVLERSLIDLKKTGGEIALGDLAELVGVDILDLEETQRRIDSVKQMYGDGFDDIRAQFMQDLPSLGAPQIVAEQEIEARIKALQDRLAAVASFDTGAAMFTGAKEGSVILDHLAEQWDKVTDTAKRNAKAAGRSAQDRIDAAQRELDHMHLEKDERTVLLETLQLEIDLKRRGVVNAEELADSYREVAMALVIETAAQKKSAEQQKTIEKLFERTAENRQRAKQAIEGMHKSLELEQRMLGLNADQRERVAAVMEYASTLRETEAHNVLQQAAAYEQLFLQFQNERRWHELADTISGSLGNTFNDLILGASDFEGAVKSLGQNVGRAILEKQVTDPLVDALSGKLAEALPKIFGETAAQTAGAAASAGILEAAGVALAASMEAGAAAAGATLIASATQAAAVLSAAGVAGGIAGAGANGLVAGSNGIIPMAKGGIITGPTLFPMANGETVLGGEEDAEAIMPLKRTSTGRLGIEAVGGGGTTNNFYQTIYTPDSDSFRSSSRQLADQARRQR